MSKGKRAAFIVLLVIFVGASVYMSFNMISRPTYEFTYSDNVRDTGKAGCIFDGFNGNAATTEVHIDHPYNKVSGKWVADETKNVIAVDSYTFISDEYVKYIYIGPSVEVIDEQAFVYCKQLRAIYVDDENPNYCDVDGVLYTKDMKTALVYPLCRCTELVFNDIQKFGEVKNIGLDIKESFDVSGKDADAQFADFHAKVHSANGDDITKELFDELLERGVTAPYIGTYYIIKDKTANSLKIEKAWSTDEKYTVPDGVERIAANCFYKCDRITALTLPSSVKEIGDMAFFKCYGVSLIALPDGLKTIGDDAFSYCENMKYAMFIPESVTHIGHHCFYKCQTDMDFYMGAKDDADIELGGRWQPRSDNSFKAKSPLWGKTRSECDAFNAEKYAQDEAAASGQSEDDGGNNSSKDDGLNKTAMIIIIVCFFIPGFIFIALQVIRNMFKKDFLMTAKQKEKLRLYEEEKELIHKAYINSDAEEKTESENKTSDERKNENDEGGEN